MKTAVIDVGGGMRDVYGSGVFDFCLDNGIGFDYCIGISAGTFRVILRGKGDEAVAFTTCIPSARSI